MAAKPTTPKQAPSVSDTAAPKAPAKPAAKSPVTPAVPRPRRPASGDVTPSRTAKGISTFVVKDRSDAAHDSKIEAVRDIVAHAKKGEGAKLAQKAQELRRRLVLAEDDLLELFLLFRKEDEILQEPEQLGDGAELLHLRLQVAHLLVLPVEEVPPRQVPGHAVVEVNDVRDVEHLWRR